MPARDIALLRSTYRRARARILIHRCSNPSVFQSPSAAAVVDFKFLCQVCIIICGRRMWRNVASSSTWQHSRFLPVFLKSSRTEAVESL